MTVLIKAPEPNLSAIAAAPEGLHLWWLGQAGFLISMGGLRIVVDPYLSDSLAVKYAGTPFPHRRMAPPPLFPEALDGIDWLLCSHAHSDHMDSETIVPLLASNPRCRVLAPQAERAAALARGVPTDRLVGIEADHTVDLGGVTVTAIPAKHETFKRDHRDRHRLLGYILHGGGVSVYHAGDTIPFAGQAERLAPHAVDLALLPVNGRDAKRLARGVPGNLTLDESVNLAERIGARAMLGHHFGMFDFNTLDPDLGRRRLAELAPSFDAKLAETGKRYALAPPRIESSPLRILFVCRGNICRSPTAEGVLRRMLSEHHPGAPVEIDSAAILDGNDGKPPDPRSVVVARARGTEIGTQRARQIGDNDFHDFDFILGMDADNMRNMSRRKPSGARARLLLLAAFLDPETNHEILDPYDSDTSAFERTYQKIETSCQALMRVLEAAGRFG